MTRGSSPDAGRRGRPTLQAAALLVIGLAACRDGGPGPATMVTDSAGIRITLTRDDGRIYARLEPMPVVSLGGADASGPTAFFNVRGVHLDRDGQLWVADTGSGEVRVFGPDGAHRKTVGGQGDGPGEFRRLRMLGPFRGDSVAFWDDVAPRLTILTPAGDLARVTPILSGDDAPPPQALGIYDDGSLLIQVPRILAAASLAPGQVFGDTARLFRADPAGLARRPLATAPGPSWLWTGRGQVPIAFTTNPSARTDPERLLLAWGPDFRIRVIEDSLREVFGVDRAPRPVTEEHIGRYSAFLERAMPDATQRAGYLMGLDHPDRPGHIPAYSGILLAEDGAVWALVYSPDPLAPACWDVFARDRTWLGRVRTPARFQAMALRGDRVAGIWRDEWDVEHVRVYHVTPGPP